MIEIIGNTPLEIVILLSAKTFALSAEFEVNKLPAAHKIKQAAKIIWDRNTRETVKPPIGLRKSECVFSLASPWIHWSFHELSNETNTFKQTMFNQCFLVKQWCLLFQRTFSALTFSVLLASKTVVTLIHPIFSFFLFCFFFKYVCACVRLSSAFFIVCVSRCGERKVCQP